MSLRAKFSGEGTKRQGTVDAYAASDDLPKQYKRYIYMENGMPVCFWDVKKGKPDGSTISPYGEDLEEFFEMRWDANGRQLLKPEWAAQVTIYEVVRFRQ